MGRLVVGEAARRAVGEAYWAVRGRVEAEDCVEATGDPA